MSLNTTSSSSLDTYYNGLYSSASTGWRDVIYYHGSTGPSTLQVQVEVDGVLGTSVAGGPVTKFAEADVWVHSPGNYGLYTNTYASEPVFPNPTQSAWARLYTQQAGEPSDGTFFSSSAVGPSYSWTSFNSEGTSFQGVYTVNAYYDPAYGGYTWGLEVVANTVSFLGSASANLLDTVSLTSVNLPDGTPISPGDLQFASGLTLSSVPEPSSLIIADRHPDVHGLLVGSASGEDGRLNNRDGNRDASSLPTERRIDVRRKPGRE